MKCIILGAGASAGYDDNLSEMDKPQITSSMLLSGIKLGILRETRYRRLCGNLKAEAERANESFELFLSKLDIEAYLELIFEKAEEEVKEGNVPSFDRYDNFAGTLGEIWYLVWELTKYYSIVANPTNNNYCKLISSFKALPFSVITTNYDTIFESVIRYNHEKFDYLIGSDSVTDRNIIHIAKVHGSINWLNNFSHLISHPSALNTDELLNRIAPTIHNNYAFNDIQHIVDPIEITQFDLSSILRSGTEYYEPILMPPLGKNKNFEKSVLYQQVWNAAESFLNHASELVVIGSSLRPQDVRFCDAVHVNVKKGTKIIAVSPRESSIKDRLVELCDWLSKDDIEYYPAFSEYTDSL